ncbi:methylamine utilization protein [Paremcibacter congregatus]|uniref:methylamine utilization protein n=1 Tax=Paremcibacter congregatus TaxID=2043170 RepID=UPI003A8F8A2D
MANLYGFIACLMVGTLWSNAAFAGSATVSVLDQEGNPVPNAVVSFTSGDISKNNLSPGQDQSIMSQENKQFVPHVLPVQVGSNVLFPNKDDYRHMVYSFSKAKTFQIKLYGGENQISVPFEKPGVVPVGCNIHDGMLGYIVVLNTGHFAKTDEKGQAIVSDIPSGTYRTEIWHPVLQHKGAEYTQELAVPADNTSLPVTFMINLKQ